MHLEGVRFNSRGASSTDCELKKPPDPEVVEHQSDLSGSINFLVLVSGGVASQAIKFVPVGWGKIALCL